MDEDTEDLTAAREQALAEHRARVESGELSVRGPGGHFLPKEHEHEGDYDAGEPGYDGEPDYTVEETNAKTQPRGSEGENL